MYSFLPFNEIIYSPILRPFFFFHDDLKIHCRNFGINSTHIFNCLLNKHPSKLNRRFVYIITKIKLLFLPPMSVSMSMAHSFFQLFNAKHLATVDPSFMSHPLSQQIMLALFSKYILKSITLFTTYTPIFWNQWSCNTVWQYAWSPANYGSSPRTPHSETYCGSTM